MTRDFLGRGWKFPVRLDSKETIGMSSHEEDIMEAIRIILSTSKGERVMHPDFSCGIHDYVFALLNTSTKQMIEASVNEALMLWEPRIELVKVQVSAEPSEEGKLIISIDYRVRSTNNQFNLVYPFYLTEGG